MNFDAMYKKHHREINGYLKKHIFDEEDALEVIQDTWFKVWRFKNSFIDDENNGFIKWSKTIAKNTFLNYLRAKSNNIVDRQTSFETRPHIEMEDHRLEEDKIKIMRKKVELFLKDVDPEFSEAYLLSVFNHCTYKEISEILKIPVGTVKSHINRVRNFIREHAEVSDFAP